MVSCEKKWVSPGVLGDRPMGGAVEASYGSDRSWKFWNFLIRPSDA